ncbi:flagellar hook-associated protein FlgL [Conyzicola nivalis]|uniref:Flagellar hook-associated protein 3 n=1 Tax=Conyzicola nivalis TaxID=1477021 RepID=A0A916SQ99_9MICO|nr:flagellar hook-associated protein FlgL [Conyzicola nivalis]GGB10280.1 flagellar hook-associated protein 3 [Conyzicola nivalis]
MINRVTNQGLAVAAQRNLQLSLGTLGKLQESASSLKRIGVPSDDPAGTADSIRVRSAQNAVAQFSRNISDGNSWMSVVDTALGQTGDIMKRVRDLTVQGANDGALSATQKEAIAVELESLRAELMTTANTKYLGRTVFAGNSDAGVAFNADLTFTGTGSPVERRISETTSIRVDANGADTFGVGDDSVFALVDNIVADLRSGVNVGTRITEIDARVSTISGQRGTVGARQAQVLKAQGANMSESVSLEAQRAEIEDVDLGKAILDLKAQEVSYQAALAVTARALQPSLMDFLS